ncbi:hypothetical protein WG66_016233 [Moniliophthora roreri]|nr:hypothetical protein WG66_016233 [Moniliophthora roreri]
MSLGVFVDGKHAIIRTPKLWFGAQARPLATSWICPLPIDARSGQMELTAMKPPEHTSPEMRNE